MVVEAKTQTFGGGFLTCHGYREEKLKTIIPGVNMRIKNIFVHHLSV